MGAAHSDVKQSKCFFQASLHFCLLLFSSWRVRNRKSKERGWNDDEWQRNLKFVCVPVAHQISTFHLAGTHPAFLNFWNHVTHLDSLLEYGDFQHVLLSHSFFLYASLCLSNRIPSSVSVLLYLAAGTSRTQATGTQPWSSLMWCLAAQLWADYSEFLTNASLPPAPPG